MDTTLSTADYFAGYANRARHALSMPLQDMEPRIDSPSYREGYRACGRRLEGFSGAPQMAEARRALEHAVSLRAEVV